MTVLAPYILCDLATADYDEVLTLWQRAGLHIRQEGRDGPESFARLSNLGYQRVIGMRAPAGSQAAGSAPAPLVAVALLTHDGRKGWINRLAVDPAHRRRGLAQRL